MLTHGHYNGHYNVMTHGHYNVIMLMLYFLHIVNSSAFKITSPRMTICVSSLFFSC